MRFLSDGIGDQVIDWLDQAVEVFLAVAFFSPDEPMMAALSAVPKLMIVVSEEFTVNDPYKLERLENAESRSVPPDHEHGKLHAKVLIAKMRDDSFLALLGSANLTHHGMFSNQEACAILESSRMEDADAISSMMKWFHLVFRNAQEPNLTLAKLIFDQRSRDRLVRRPEIALADPASYWALKTTSGGPSGDEHWPRLLAEGIVAIGWEELSVDPSQVTDQELRSALRADFGYTDRQVDIAASTIRKFIDLEDGAILLLCRGYTSNQRADVHIYGFARVTGPFQADAFNGAEWRFKHEAVIQRIDATLPRDTMATALEKESMRQTMHELDEPSFTRIAEALGVPVHV